MRPIFAVDLDSTIYDMESVMAQSVKIITGVYPKPAHTWECEVAWGVSPETSDKIWDLVWQTEIKPYRDAFHFLRKLDLMGYEVVSLSTRKPGAARDHGLWMTVDLPVTEKIWTSNSKEKADYLKRSGATFFLDDSPANHFAAYNLGVITDLLLLDRPWNQSQDIAPVWRRVHTYEEVLDIASE